MFIVSKIIPFSIESGPKKNDLVKKDAWSCNSDIFMMKPNFIFIQQVPLNMFGYSTGILHSISQVCFWKQPASLMHDDPLK
jgi:hypothetical protein